VLQGGNDLPFFIDILQKQIENDYQFDEELEVERIILTRAA